MKKRLLSTLLALCMALTLLPGTAGAKTTIKIDSEDDTEDDSQSGQHTVAIEVREGDDQRDSGVEYGALNRATQDYTIADSNFSGKCGDNVIWFFDANTQTLTLTGGGSTYAYGWYHFASPAPWADLADQIKYIRVEGSITELGGGLFEDCTSAIEITLPRTLENYNAYDFPANYWYDDLDAGVALQRFITEDSSVKYLADNGVLYEKSETGSGYDLIRYPSGLQSTSYTLRSDTNTIPGNVFIGNPYLKEIVLNETLSTISGGLLRDVPH